MKFIILVSLKQLEYLSLRSTFLRGNKLLELAFSPSQMVQDLSGLPETPPLPNVHT